MKYPKTGLELFQWAIGVIIIAALVMMMVAAITGCAAMHTDPLDPRGDCGTAGTVDADDNPTSPPPHCG